MKKWSRIKLNLLFALTIYVKGIRGERPNIIIMNMDDLGWGDLGVTGNPAKETPNLDSMAADGILHTDFYSAAAICSPSRASLLSGRLPIRNGFYQNTYRGRNSYTPQEIMGGISSNETLIPEILLQAGYKTKIIGKWHLGHREEFLPTSHGFQEWFGTPNCHFNYDVPWRPGPEIPVYRNSEMVGRYYKDYKIDQEKGVSNYTQLLVEEALQYINRDDRSPYFLYWAPDSTHGPSYSSKKFLGTSIRDSFYGDAVREIDDGIGKIIKAVKKNKRRTLVIFTSDNGAALQARDRAGSNGPLLCGKQTTFEGGFRVPTISWWSHGGPRGVVSRVAGTHMDLLPTIADLIKFKLPNSLVLDGRSLLPVLKNNGDVSDSPVFYYKGNLLYAVRFGTYKVHWYTWATPTYELAKGKNFCPGVQMENITTTEITKQDPPLMYNLYRDPGEQYPMRHKSQEYARNIGMMEKIAKEHRDTLVPGAPVLEMCDKAVMNWSPKGCEKLGSCITPPPSKPYKCYWPH